jgi:hypothetical protein
MTGSLEALAHTSAAPFSLALTAFWDNGQGGPTVAAEKILGVPGSSGKLMDAVAQMPMRMAAEREDFKKSLLRSLHAKDHKLLAQLVQDLENPNLETVTNILQRFPAEKGKEKERDEVLKILFLALLSTDPVKFLKGINQFYENKTGAWNELWSHFGSGHKPAHDLLYFLASYSSSLTYKKPRSWPLEEYLSWARQKAMPALQNKTFGAHSAFALASAGKWLSEHSMYPFRIRNHLYLDKDGYLAIQWNDEKGKNIQDLIFKEFCEDVKRVDGFWQNFSELRGSALRTWENGNKVLPNLLPILLPERPHDPKNPNVRATVDFILKTHQKIQETVQMILGGCWDYTWTDEAKRAMALYETRVLLAEPQQRKNILQEQLQFMRQSPLMLDRYLHDMTMALDRPDDPTTDQLLPLLWEEITERSKPLHDKTSPNQALATLLTKGRPKLAVEFFKKFSQKIASWDKENGRNPYVLSLQILWDKILTKKQATPSQLYPSALVSVIGPMSTDSFKELMRADLPLIHKEFFTVLKEQTAREEKSLDLGQVQELILAVVLDKKAPAHLRIEMLNHAEALLAVLNLKDDAEQTIATEICRKGILPALADISADRAAADSERLRALESVQKFIHQITKKNPAKEGKEKMKEEIKVLSHVLTQVLPTLHQEVLPGRGKRQPDVYKKNRFPYLAFHQTVINFMRYTGQEFKPSPIETQLYIVQDLILDFTNKDLSYEHLRGYTRVLIPILQSEGSLSKTEKEILRETLELLNKEKLGELRQQIQEQAKESEKSRK